jgi:peptidoglycan/xylan/chitin deacetylase (PgdA/CDA1 family)
VSVPEGYTFALCLTHDVDRPYKSVYQSLYHAATDRRLEHLRTLLPGENPYWQFEDVMGIEEALGVRSSFYFLNEPSLLSATTPRGWVQPVNWVQHLGRYEPTTGELADVVRRLDDGGWEVGLHGSYHSYDDQDRLAHEKRRLEEIVGSPVRGGRQHYLRLTIPRTWKYQSRIGLDYDASLGSSTEYGFQHGYDVVRPFGDEFVVFPLTLMEQALPDPETSFDDAWSACRDLLDEAAENDAVMTALWHLRYFSAREFPGYRQLYRRVVEYAVDAGAWVGPPIDLYDQLGHDGDCAEPDDLEAALEAAVKVEDDQIVHTG